MAHLSEQNFKWLETMANNIDLNKKLSNLIFCKTCAKINMQIQLHKVYCTLNYFFFNFIHSNMNEFLVQLFRDSFKYYVTFENDFTKFLEVCPMVNKSEIFQKFKQFKTHHKTPS